VFWDEFYTSAKKNFLQDHEKYFFVFTNNKQLLRKQKADTKFIQQRKLGWPFDTLYRFKIFLRIEEEIKKYDYVYYLNANALIVSKVGEEIFPDPFMLIGCLHPCFFNKKPNEYIYERNPDSLSFIELGNGKHYVMGAFIGGDSIAFLEMCKQLNTNIDIDYQKNIIAIWHDESHYNKYLLSNSYKLLSPSYVYPEEMNIPFHPKIMLRDKNKYGGHMQLRGIKNEISVFKLLKCLASNLKDTFSLH
jgi:hypothetical protein